MSVVKSSARSASRAHRDARGFRIAPRTVYRSCASPCALRPDHLWPAISASIAVSNWPSKYAGMLTQFQAMRIQRGQRETLATTMVRLHRTVSKHRGQRGLDPWISAVPERSHLFHHVVYRLVRRPAEALHLTIEHGQQACTRSVIPVGNVGGCGKPCPVVWNGEGRDSVTSPRSYWLRSAAVSPASFRFSARPRDSRSARTGAASPRWLPRR
jgi:hypothetical protein